MKSSKARASVVLLIKPEEEKVLVLLRDKRSNSFSNLWAFAGGGIDKLADNVWEHPTTTAKREVFEETGLKANKLIFLKKEQRQSGFIYFFYCTDFEGAVIKEKVMLEHSACAWGSLKSLKKVNTIPGTATYFQDCLKLIKEGRNVSNDG